MPETLQRIAAPLVLCLALLAGCATQTLNTPTGRPEVTIPNADLEEIKNLLTQNAIDWGYHVREVTDYRAVYEKRGEGTGEAILFGSTYDPFPLYRLQYDLLPQGEAVRIVGNLAVVTNPGSGYERTQDLSKGKSGVQIQDFLTRLASYYTGYKQIEGRGTIGVQIDQDDLTILKVDAGSPAEQAGLQVGDRIVAVDGEPVADWKESGLRITGTPGTVVTLTVERDGQTRVIEVTRGAPIDIWGNRQTTPATTPTKPAGGPSQ